MSSFAPKPPVVPLGEHRLQTWSEQLQLVLSQEAAGRGAGAQSKVGPLLRQPSADAQRISHTEASKRRKQYTPFHSWGNEPFFAQVREHLMVPFITKSTLGQAQGEAP